MPSAPGRVRAAYGVRPPRNNPGASPQQPSASFPDITFPGFSYYEGP
jgi:hypothetical protein